MNIIQIYLKFDSNKNNNLKKINHSIISSKLKRKNLMLKNYLFIIIKTTILII